MPSIPIGRDLSIDASDLPAFANGQRFASKGGRERSDEWALPPLRVRGFERVQLQADLTILAKLACALARARAVSFAA
jgi:hypothetical protein